MIDARRIVRPVARRQVRRQDIENNKIDGTYYLDAHNSVMTSISGRCMEAFFNVRNLLNNDPEIVPQDKQALPPRVRCRRFDGFDLRRTRLPARSPHEHVTAWTLNNEIAPGTRC